MKISPTVGAKNFSPLFAIILAIMFATQILFAQEFELPSELEQVLPPAVTAALPQPMSIADALKSSNVPDGCTQDFSSLFEDEDFDLAKFMKTLPQDVAKVKVQLKSPFGKPKDSDKTSSGVTVSCIKALPESPAEVATLLKNISIKMGMDLAVDAAANFADNSIPANVAAESGGGMFGRVSAISLAVGGLGTIIYGLVQNSEVSRNVKDKDGKAAVDAESRRNVSYGIGAGLLAGGLTVYLVF